MKTTLRMLVAACFAAFALPSQAQQLIWGSSGGSFVVDSDGDGVDDSFVFELGAFPLGFNPDENEPDLWAANWMLFDAIDYNPLLGRFSGDVFIGNGVTSTSIQPNVSTESFAGLTAYLWIRNSDEAIPGSEWLLVRSGGVDDAWTFPLVGGDCCTTTIIEWSVSDLDPDTGNPLDPKDLPLWGRQNNVIGDGSYTPGTTGTPPGLQTFTFVPEPSTALLAAIAGLGLAVRRKRTPDSL